MSLIVATHAHTHTHTHPNHIYYMKFKWAEVYPAPGTDYTVSVWSHQGTFQSLPNGHDWAQAEPYQDKHNRLRLLHTSSLVTHTQCHAVDTWT